MKAKATTMAIGLFLSAAAVWGAVEDVRFCGGSYDGWDRRVMPQAWGLDGSFPVNVRWCGGAYDGWGAATSEPMDFWVHTGTLLLFY